jgi:hypothetical protein
MSDKAKASLAIGGALPVDHYRPRICSSAVQANSVDPRPRTIAGVSYDIGLQYADLYLHDIRPRHAPFLCGGSLDVAAKSRWKAFRLWRTYPFLAGTSALPLRQPLLPVVAMPWISCF